MASEMLRFMQQQTVSSLKEVYIQWAREFGANIDEEQEDAALLRLKALIPEASSWPSLTINSVSGSVAVDKTAPGKKSRGKAARRCSDFPKLVVPEGVEAPTCPVVLQSGKRKGEACGKKCSRTLFEHDPESSVACANLTCDHCYCGTHIVKCSESSVLTKLRNLESKADPNGDKVVLNTNGDKQAVSLDVLDDLKPDDHSVIADKTINRLMENLGAARKKKAESADDATANDANSNEN